MTEMWLIKSFFLDMCTTLQVVWTHRKCVKIRRSGGTDYINGGSNSSSGSCQQAAFQDSGLEPPGSLHQLFCVVRNINGKQIKVSATAGTVGSLHLRTDIALKTKNKTKQIKINHPKLIRAFRSLRGRIKNKGKKRRDLLLIQVNFFIVHFI